MKLLIISHHLVFEQYQIRWKELANDYSVQVRALIPEKWRSSYYQGVEQFITTKVLQDGNFEVYPVSVSNNTDWWSYEINNLRNIINDYQPDVVFAIADEFFSVTKQCAKLRRKTKHPFKFMFFSTHACLQIRNAIDFQHKVYYSLKWYGIRRKVDAILCHYPEQETYFRRLGFKNIISVQTQVGIDMEVFKPDEKERKTIREKYNWSDTIIGFAGRMIKGKGIYTLFEACKNEKWHIVYLGSGPDVELLKKAVNETPHTCTVEFIEKVSAMQVGQYLNAFDIFYTGSLTLKDWEDTFPNAVSQAEACKKPVIVSDSCALPYLAGEWAPSFHEGDASDLRDKIDSIVNDTEKQKEFGERGYERCLNMFSTKAVNKLFYNVLMEVVKK